MLEESDPTPEIFFQQLRRIKLRHSLGTTFHSPHGTHSTRKVRNKFCENYIWLESFSGQECAVVLGGAERATDVDVPWRGGDASHGDTKCPSSGAYWRDSPGSGHLSAVSQLSRRPKGGIDFVPIKRMFWQAGNRRPRLSRRRNRIANQGPEMKVELLPSTVGESAPRQFCIGAVVNDSLAIDAGTLGLLWPLERQRQIRHIFLSHSHLDHIATLPLYLDNVYHDGPDCPVVFADEATQRCLREDIFNNRLWPDFIQLSEEESPFLKLRLIEPDAPVKLSGLTVTPISLNHVVPTLGFILQAPTCAIAFVSDTGPTDTVWKILSQTVELKAVFLEASLPNSHRWLAEKSGHLCPEMFVSEIKQLAESVRIIACHLKPAHFDAIAVELNSLGRSRLEIGVPGCEYIF